MMGHSEYSKPSHQADGTGDGSSKDALREQLRNRPGLAQIKYRIGDYTSFRDRLLAALPKALQPPVGTPGEAPLARLTTRDDTDPAIALLDAWAVAADVLTFYQERIANEGFLRTATERRSVLELARAIGYELAPGVAASANLIFKVEDAPGSPTVVPIPERTQVMSVPAKGELPQIFETTEPFTAHLEWNGLRPRPHRPQTVDSQTRQLYLSGTNTQLSEGDMLLLVDESPNSQANSQASHSQAFVLPLNTVTVDNGADYTLVTWRESWPAIATPLRRPKVFAFRQQARLFGYNAPDWEIMPAEVKLDAVEKSGDSIQGGVFRSDSDGILWSPTSQGLPNQNITCLATKQAPDGTQIVFAGTPEKGIFRSTDNGQHWQAVNSGLTNLKIQTLHVDSEGDPIYAGTPSGGVFRSKDNGDNWVAINTGSLQTRRVAPPPDGEERWEPVNTSIPDTVVRSLLTYTDTTSLGQGTISSNGTTVTGVETFFSTDLTLGDHIADNPSGTGSRAVDAIASNQSITLHSPFGNMPEGTAYEATATFNSTLTVVNITDQLMDWTRALINLAIGPITTEVVRVFPKTDEVLDLANANLLTDVPNLLTEGDLWLRVLYASLQTVNTFSQQSLAQVKSLVEPLINTTLATVQTKVTLKTDQPGAVELIQVSGLGASLLNQPLMVGNTLIPVVLIPGIILSGGNKIVTVPGLGLILDLFRQSVSAFGQGNVNIQSTHLELSIQIEGMPSERRTIEPLNDPFKSEFQVVSDGEQFPSDWQIPARLPNVSNPLWTSTLTVTVLDTLTFQFQVGNLLIEVEEIHTITQYFPPLFSTGVATGVAAISGLPIANGSHISTKVNVNNISIANPALPSGGTIQSIDKTVIGSETDPPIKKFTLLKASESPYALTEINPASPPVITMTIGSGSNSQTKNVVSIESDTELTLDEAFQSDLPEGTEYFIFSDALGTPKELQRKYIVAGTDDGPYRSMDYAQNWTLVGSDGDVRKKAIYSLASAAISPGDSTGHYIFAGTDSGLYRSQDHGKIWHLISDNNETFQTKIIYALLTNNTHVFVGTNSGLYLLPDNGSLENDFDIEETVAFQDSVIYALTAYERESAAYCFAATSAGLHRNLAEQGGPGNVSWDQENWAPFQQGAIAPLTIIALDAGENAVIYAGSQFSDFLPAEPSGENASSSTEPNGDDPANAVSNAALLTPPQAEWPNFRLQDPRQVDLETLYPQILPESWMLLVSDRHPKNPAQQIELMYAVRQVESVVDVDRQDFGLSSKLTRLEPDRAIDPDPFGLRSTLVLGGSTELPLAPEPLSVGDRQHDIFADPMMGKTVYLRDFIHNLTPNQTLIVSGKPMQMQLSDVGGVLRSRYAWTPLVLPELSINALMTAPVPPGSPDPVPPLLAATNNGLYRSQDHGETWASLPAMQFKAVHSLLATTDAILLGADLELYQLVLNADSEQWTRFTTPTPASILSLLTYTFPASPAPQIEALSGITVTVNAVVDIFTTFPVGTVITVADQTRVVTEIHPDRQQFIINAIFDPEPTIPSPLTVGGPILLAGTDQGFFRSTDQGATWEYLSEQRDRQIYALLSWETNQTLTLYAATDRGLYFSTNTGEKWDRVEALWDYIKPYPAVYVLALFNNQLVAGTAKGLYTSATLDGRDWTPVKGLSDRAILSLTTEASTLYAGTDQGIYCSTNGITTTNGNTITNGGDTWDALDAGLTASSGRALLLHQIMSNNVTNNRQLIVGTEQGITTLSEPIQRVDPVSWSRSNTGIVNSQLLSMAHSMDGTTVVAGTTAGLYRSTSGGRTWTAWDKGLTQIDGPDKLRVRTVVAASGAVSGAASEDGAERDRWFVGTPEGVFIYAPDPSNPDRDPWQPLGRDTLPYADIRILKMHGNWLLAGTIDGGIFRLDVSQLNSSLSISALRQQQWQSFGLNNTDVQAIALSPNSSQVYAGTLTDGVYRSLDNGITWQQITHLRQGPGTLKSDGTQVIWTGASVNNLKVGDVITAAGQSRTLSRLDRGVDQNIVALTVDAPFRPNLTAGTPFTINTGLTNRDITALAVALEDENGAEKEVLYAGTDGSGVFRSIAGEDSGRVGDRWQQVIANLEDLEIRCLTYEKDTNTLWAGTASAGVFRFDPQRNLWSAVNTDLTNTDIRAILKPTTSTLLVGGIGFLRSADNLTVKWVQRNDQVQVVKPPQAHASYQAWFVRDKDNFEGSLHTSSEQIFPLSSALEETPLVSEEVVIKHPPTDQQQPILLLQDKLTYSYDPATVEFAANVVPATHGETALEVLGSGDGNVANQQFVLKKPPLTYVAAANASGAESTLEVRVDGVLWEQKSSLYPLTPQEQAYIVRIEDDGTTSVTTGDGHRGARLPSGQENITARYRSGIGTDGNVPATQLSILKTRPQGIGDVTNPLAATGGANSESLAAARTNAPPTARTLGRIVSLQDFQDFAQGFAGIGKAQAVALFDGGTPVVHITVAGADGTEVPETSNLYTTLLDAIAQARDPLQQVQVASFDQLFFNVEARILLNPRYQADVVTEEIKTGLTQTFTFEQRDFGQAVTSAEVIATIQKVKGVTAVDLDALYVVGRSKALNDSLTARTARYNPQSQHIYPAQLLLLSPVGIQLSVVPVL